jgi:hypothetical protein
MAVYINRVYNYGRLVERVPGGKRERQAVRAPTGRIVEFWPNRRSILSAYSLSEPEVVKNGYALLRQLNPDCAFRV